MFTFTDTWHIWTWKHVKAMYISWRKFTVYILITFSFYYGKHFYYLSLLYQLFEIVLTWIKTDISNLVRTARFRNLLYQKSTLSFAPIYNEDQRTRGSATKLSRSADRIRGNVIVMLVVLTVWSLPSLTLFVVFERSVYMWCCY